VDFWKYGALGNTFLVTPAERVPTRETLAWVEQSCDPAQGVVADGVVIVHVPTARISIYNADGSRAPLSGNGARCAAAWWFAEQDRHASEITWRTDAGPVRCLKRGQKTIEASIPAPDFNARAIPARIRSEEVWRHRLALPGHSRRAVTIYALSVGNPQCVIWGRSFPARWWELGAAICQHRLFPEQTNVAFVRPVAGGLEARLWERGVGETQSSGTGAAAAAVVAARLGKGERRTTVQMPGGSMRVHWRTSGEISLASEVRLVASGELAIKTRAA
jgi:diaminopimelate epimerase